ncbi:unnamed protein product [Aureobasidium pullulans]|nr:unnamed protein product [Aureobasidium pullulans]
MSPIHSLLFAVAASTVSTLAIPILQPTDVLRLSPDGSFQLSIFSDLHFGEAEDTLWGPLQDVKSARVMNSVLDAENSTGLVVLNGDLITGENTFLHNSTKYLDAVVAPLVHRGMSWANTYGNHDSDFNISRQGIFEQESKYSLSRTKNMVSSSDAGVSNYYLPVYGNDSAVPEFLLCVAFVHIPVNAMAAFQAQGVDTHREPGINDDNPLAQQGSASGQGDVSGAVFTYNGQDIPFMQALLDTKGLKAVFSGHDHGDDWCFRWDSKLKGMNLTGNGLDLCFDRRSGYGGYGSWTRGSRQVVLRTGKDDVQTWVRLEDGSISAKVTLNGTYGQDSYPSVKA